MITYAVVILFVAWVLWHLLSFNSLTKNLNAITQSWSNTEVELKRRLDLIGNLVEVVKGYSTHEAETLSSVVSARNQSSFVADAAAATNSTNLIKNTLGKIFAIAESYPDLKANKQFLELQLELTNTENRIAERRHAYNQNVSLYENSRLAFPDNLVAWVHQFPAATLFDVPDESVSSAVKVEL